MLTSIYEIINFKIRSVTVRYLPHVVACPAGKIEVHCKVSHNVIIMYTTYTCTYVTEYEKRDHLVTKFIFVNLLQE